VLIARRDLVRLTAFLKAFAQAAIEGKEATAVFKLVPVIALVAVTIATQPPAMAASETELTAGALYEFCNSADLAVSNACRFYILGAVDGISVAGGLANDKNHFCLPDNVQGARLVEIFRTAARADIQAFPQDSNEPAISLVGAAMAHAFPCPKGN
jgi:hypothetical protein